MIDTKDEMAFALYAAGVDLTDDDAVYRVLIEAGHSIRNIDVFLEEALDAAHEMKMNNHQHA